jgi:hypothetical protein
MSCYGGVGVRTWSDFNTSIGVNAASAAALTQPAGETVLAGLEHDIRGAAHEAQQDELDQLPKAANPSPP